MIDKGIPRNKLNLAIPTYGKTFQLKNPTMNGLGSPAIKGEGTSGPYTQNSGTLGYNEICEIFNTECWNVVREEMIVSPYAYKDTDWFGYDDMKSVESKVKFAFKMNLSGIMVWSIDTDDFNGQCHGVKFPLVKSINMAFSGEPSVPFNKSSPCKGKNNDNNYIKFAIITVSAVVLLVLIILLIILSMKHKNKIQESSEQIIHVNQEPPEGKLNRI